MKKIFLILLFIGIKSALAQNITTGLKAGINISNFTGENSSFSKSGSLIGFHAGGFLNFKFTGISLQTELLISTAGAKLAGLWSAVAPQFEQFRSAKCHFGRELCTLWKMHVCLEILIQ